MPVLRQSCGCPSPHVELVSVKPPLIDDEKEVSIYEAIPRPKIVKAIAKTLTFEGQDTFLLAGEVLDAFMDAFIQEEPEVFLTEWSHKLRWSFFAHRDLSCWQKALSVMRHQMLPWLTGKKAVYHAENLWHQARVLLAEIAQQTGMQPGTQESRNAILLQEINETLLMTFDMAELLDLLASMLPRLGIKSYYLSLYEKLFLNEPINLIPDWSYLILAYDEKRRLPLPKEGERFPSVQLVPDKLLSASRRRDLLVMPLFVQDTQLGIGLFEMDYPDVQLFNILRNQISNAIYGALLFQQAQQTQTELKQRVEERTQELELRECRIGTFHLYGVS